MSPLDSAKLNIRNLPGIQQGGRHRDFTGNPKDQKGSQKVEFLQS